MTSAEHLKHIQDLLEDYNEELWADPQVQTNLMFLLGRQISTGQDISDDELLILDEFLQKKVNEFIKIKSN
jgi:hypothetical protein